MEKQYGISIEVDAQLNQEIFQRDNPISNQSALSFDQLFELNELKAQSQEKDAVIKKLKKRIKVLSGTNNKDKIKQELEEIETINIELDHRVKKLIAKNKHLKQTYKQHNDSIKANTYAKLVQELLTNISNTCPSINNVDGKLVAVTPKNKDKSIRFTKPITYSGNTITKTTSASNLVSNKPMLSSIGVKPSTSASKSQLSGNTKKDKIRQTPSSTKKNKHSRLNANSELKSVKVPHRKPTALENETPKPVVTLVYSRKPRKSKTNVPDSKTKVPKSVSAKKKEPI
ncbi:hypothetical protein Tco_0482496 [Tanacetum coccineum]